MLDIKKLRKECMETVHSHSADFLQKWLDSYNRRIAMADNENDSFEKISKPRRAADKLNEASVSVAPKNIHAKTFRNAGVKTNNSVKTVAT